MRHDPRTPQRSVRSNCRGRRHWSRPCPLVRVAVHTALSAVLLISGGAAGQEPPYRLSVLFIGNSLTIENDLPAMLEALLKSAGVDEVTVLSLSRPGYGLEDHWRLGVARKMIKDGDWDVVVLQQGPSATEGRPSLLEYAGRFAEEIERAGGRTALYMVWPSRQRFFDFGGVSESYAIAAGSVGGLLLPVGDAWRATWRRDPDVPLYGPDAFHPSPAATYLAALVIFQRLTGLDPRGMPARLGPDHSSDFVLPDELAALLQEAAAEANAGLADGDAGPPD
jgi:hypothetical protein